MHEVEARPSEASRKRRLAVATLLTLATLLTIGAGIGIWAQRQALDTDEWVDTSGRLLENESVRTAVGLYLVDQLYSSADTEQRIRELLPPRLDRLAGPASAAFKEVARRTAPRLLGNARALAAWRDANRAAHTALLRVVDGEGGGVRLDLSMLLAQVADGTGLPSSAVDRLPPDLAELEVLPPDELESVRSAVDAFRVLGWILFALAVVAYAGAFALSRDRRRTAISVGACLLVAGIALLAVRRLAGQAVVDALADAPNAHGAADDVWAIATSLLVDVAQGAMLLGLIVVTGAWLAGPGRRASWVRRVSAPTLREHPGAARAALGVALLLLVIWRPVPWTGRILPLLLLTVAAFIWLEAIRRRTLVEFAPEPGAPASASADQRAAAPTATQGGTT